MEIKRIINYNPEIIKQISQIHYSVLKESFLNNFGLTFLEKIYENLSKSNNSIFLVAFEDREVIGYLLAVIDYSKFMKIAISKNKIQIFWLITKTLIKNPSMIWKLISSLFKTSNETPHAELQFIAIKPEHQGKNIGTKLVDALNREFSKAHIKNYVVGTKSSDKLSNKFYQKLGFIKSYTKNYFGDELNFYISP